MNDRPIRSTAHLIAHAYTNPNDKIMPQIHTVQIYSESATNLSYIGKNSAALDVFQVSAPDYQQASDLLCYLVQTEESLAWCRPLMDPRYMEPIDYLRVELFQDDYASICTLKAILRAQMRNVSEVELATIVRDHVYNNFVLGSTVNAINDRLRDNEHTIARVWLKRDYDRMKDAEETNENAVANVTI